MRHLFTNPPMQEVTIARFFIKTDSLLNIPPSSTHVARRWNNRKNTEIYVIWRHSAKMVGLSSKYARNCTCYICLIPSTTDRRLRKWGMWSWRRTRLSWSCFFINIPSTLQLMTEIRMTMWDIPVVTIETIPVCYHSVFTPCMHGNYTCIHVHTHAHFACRNIVSLSSYVWAECTGVSQPWTSWAS